MNVPLAATVVPRLVTLPLADAPSKFRTPNIRLGGIPLVSQQFSWGLIPGPVPFRTSYQFVDGPLVDRLRGLKNPIELEIDVDGEINKTPAPYKQKFSNLWITEPRKVDAYHWLFEIADMRIRWEGQRFTWSANKTWRKNEQAQALNLGQFSANDPALLRAQFDRFELFRYLPWSKNPKTEKPWTALELLVLCLSTLEGGASVSVTADDNGVVQENLEWQEEPVQQVLTELCSLARVQIGVTPTGQPHIYQTEEVIDPGSVMPISRPPIDGGVLYLQDLHRIRPARSNVRFRRRREVLAVRTDAPTVPIPAASAKQPIIGPTRSANGDSCPAITEEDYRRGNCVACFNVLKAPRDFSYGGTNYQKGQWVPVHTFIGYMGYTDAEIRKMYFNDILIMDYAVIRSGRPLGKPDPLRMVEAQALKQHYRRTYQMDPYWVQRWEDWDTKRAALIDPVTRFSLPSPVWQDFAFVPVVFMPQHSKYVPEWRDRAFNYKIADDNPQRIAAQSFAELTIADSQAGVFTVEVPQDPDQTIDYILPSAIDNPPSVSPAADTILWFVENTSLAAAHTFEAIVSVTPAVDSDDQPTDKRFMTVSTDSGDGLGQEVEWLANEEVARYPHMQGIDTSTPEGAALKASADANIACNIGVLVSIGKTQAEILAQSYRDRYSGHVVFPGADANKMRLFGPCRSIIVEFSESNGLRSFYDLTEPIPIPQLVSMLTPQQRRIVYGQLKPED